MDPSVATAKGSSYIDDEEDEEDVCRICRYSGDADNPLRYPCACNGSIKFVHQDCLLQWLNYGNARRCEVCKHRFSFSPVYAEKAPTRLPFVEFVVGVAMKPCRCRVLHLFLRLAFVLSIWFLAIPFITFWIWRFAFVRSFDEAQRLFLCHISTTAILIGFLLSACVVFLLRGTTALRGYFRHLREDVPFYELVGMQGPVFHLVETAFDVLASNVIVIGIVIFVPFTLGRFILYQVSSLFAARDLPVTASMHLIDTGLSLENITLKSVLTVVSNLTNKGQENGLLGQVMEMVKVNGGELNGAHDTLSVAADLLMLSDVTTLTVGYMLIVSLVVLYLGIIALNRYVKGEPLTIGTFYGMASIVETVQSLLRQFLAAMRLGIRVAFSLVFGFGVFPLMCGWWLDVCTIRMFGKTMSHRVEFLSVYPLASSVVHWVVGLMYFWQVFIFENLLREVLRPGVLNFLIDPAEEDYTFQDLIGGSVRLLARDLLFESAEFGCLIVMLVYLPVKLALWMAPSIFPLDISVSDPFTEITASVLLLQICIPLIIEHFGLQTTIKSLLRCWFTGVGWALGLTNFLLPRPEENIGQDNRNGEPGRQNRAQVLQVGGPDRAMAAVAAAGNVKTGEEYEEDEERSGSEVD